ncbi:MAG: hypothetical protein R2939_14460 [Kofleriaceae bacterium]
MSRSGWLLVALGVAGCGEPPIVGVDAAVDAAGADAAPDAAPPRDDDRALVATSDGTAGALVSLDLPSQTLATAVLPALATAQPALRRLGRTVYLADRTGDQITVIDGPSQTHPPPIALPAGSHPVDVARLGDRLYVVAEDGVGLLVIDLVLGGPPVALDLGALDPDDGLPNCTSAYAVGGNVFVVCAVLDDGAPGRPPRGVAKVAIVDGDDDSLAGMLDLPWSSPVGQLQPTPLDSHYVGDLVIGLAPSEDDLSTGCLARIGVDATPTTGCVIDNEDLLGVARRVEMAPGGGLLWIAVTAREDGVGRGSVRGFDVDSATVWDGSLSPASQEIVDLAVCPSGDLVVADVGATEPGLRVYSGGTTLELTTAAVALDGPLGPRAGIACTRR